jgi:TatD DNase family protein
MSANLVDIGCNLTARAFRRDVDAVISRARDAGVARMIVTGLTVELSWAAHRLASRYPGVLTSTAGVHPHNARTCNSTTIGELRELAGREGVVAVGECGLDYNRNFSPPEVQRRWFVAQLELAAELGLPVFLHERDAGDDFTAIVGEHREALTGGGVVHCFTGDRAALGRYLALDLHIGITGWICDERRGRHLSELVRDIPAGRLMVETDAPFLRPRDLAEAPIARRRNEPMNLPHILARVARARSQSPCELAATTTATAERLFTPRPAQGS